MNSTLRISTSGSRKPPLLCVLDGGLPDGEHVAEEIDEMGRRNTRKLEAASPKSWEHLLKRSRAKGMILECNPRLGRPHTPSPQSRNRAHVSVPTAFQARLADGLDKRQSSLGLVFFRAALPADAIFMRVGDPQSAGSLKNTTR